MVRGRQWRGGVRNLGLNLALPLQGAGPPVHLDAKERRNEYAARAVIGPPRPPPPPPHYNFPNRILQSGPYSLAHKQFCFSALEPVNHAEREHLGRRRGPPRALPRAPPRAPPSGFVPGGRRGLGWGGTGALYGVPGGREDEECASGECARCASCARLGGLVPGVRVLPLTSSGSVPGQSPLLLPTLCSPSGKCAKCSHPAELERRPQRGCLVLRMLRLGVTRGAGA